MAVIDRTISIFSRVDVEDTQDAQKIDGSVFGDDMSPYNFYVRKAKGTISVQTCSKKDAQQTMYMFGVMIYEEEGEQNAWVYHHGHGPFNIFGFEYERP